MNREEARAFGEELRRLRTERGISLEEISRETKIRKVVLEAFEGGRFEELPPEVFATGFLKAYAQRLGAPPGPLVARFQRILRPPAPLPAPEKAPPARRALPWLLLGILAAAAVAFWVLLGRSTPSPPLGGEKEPGPPAAAPQEPPPPPSAPEPTREPSPPPAERPSPPGSATVPPSSPPMETSPAAASAPSLPAGDLVLRTSGPCWVELWSGEKRLLRRELAPGEAVAFAGERFRADFGNSGAVEVFFRGRPLPLRGAPGKPLKGVLIPPPAGGEAP
ncbi:MAG: helix-turn-helix domain-containing protein [Acidobacteriota bacterium]